MASLDPGKTVPQLARWGYRTRESLQASVPPRRTSSFGSRGA